MRQAAAVAGPAAQNTSPRSSMPYAPTFRGTTQVVAMHIDPVSIDALNTGFAGDPDAQCRES